jgi:hypothetical protein
LRRGLHSFAASRLGSFSGPHFQVRRGQSSPKEL